MKFRKLSLALLFLILAGILVSCDAIGFPYLNVDKVVILDQTAYIHVSQKFGRGLTGLGIPNLHNYYTSQDYGKTWDEISSIPIQITNPVTEPGKNNLSICALNNSEICYRITGKTTVEISRNAGKDWQIDWEMPLGRQSYMQKNPIITPFLGVEPDIIPYDLGIITKDNKNIVIVAMGNQGVLVKSIDGAWERYSINPEGKISSEDKLTVLATPLPFYATNVNDALIALDTETALAFFATFIFTVIFSLRVWSAFRSHLLDENLRKRFLWSYIPLLSGIIGLFLLIFLLIFSIVVANHPLQDFFSSEFVYNHFTDIRFLPIIGLFFSWVVVILIFPNRKTSFLAALMLIGCSIAFFAGTWLPFLFWAFGIPANYEIALLISGLLAILTFYFSSQITKRLSKSSYSVRA